MEGATVLILGSFSMALPTCQPLLHHPIWRGKRHKPQLICLNHDTFDWMKTHT